MDKELAVTRLQNAVHELDNAPDYAMTMWIAGEIEDVIKMLKESADV